MVESNSGRIEVIGAGLGRTGTKSLQAALDILGYKTYHFVFPEHAEHWASYAEGRGASSDDCLDLIAKGGYTATCDQPTADLYAEQLRKYPNAKVVLTIRDSPAAWEESWKVLMNFIEIQERPFSIGYPSFIQWIPFMRHWKTMRGLMGTHIGLQPGELIRGWRCKPGGWLAKQYSAHNDKVAATVPAEKLLVFNVKEGWAPLCEFFGKAIPDKPFPFANESSEIQMATKVMVAVTYSWIPLLFLGASGTFMLLNRMKRRGA